MTEKELNICRMIENNIDYCKYYLTGDGIDSSKYDFIIYDSLDIFVNDCIKDGYNYIAYWDLAFSQLRVLLYENDFIHIHSFMDIYLKSDFDFEVSKHSIEFQEYLNLKITKSKRLFIIDKLLDINI